ncbi:MAG: TolC family protein [Bacteroidetes bacterium]|nr:TolC family protein [Bacteroidota bacterium]
MKRNLVMGLLLSTVMAFAQEGSKILTFDDAIKIALKNGVLLNQQKNNLDLAVMQRNFNIAGLGPTLGFNAYAQRAAGNSFVQQTGKLAEGITDNTGASLNANINLFNGFSQVNRVKQSLSALDAQLFYVNRTEQDIMNTVATQYLQVLLDIELLKIANENWEALKKQLIQIKEQVNLGAKSQVDEYNQDSQAKAAEIRSLTAQVNLVNDRALLTMTLLLDPNEEFNVVKPTWNLNTADRNEDFELLFDTALKNRADYLRAVKNEESAKYGMKAIRASMLPTLSMYASGFTAYNYFYGTAGPNQYTFTEQLKTVNLKKWAGFNLNIPILGGSQNFQNRTNYVLQKATYLNNQIIRRNTEIQVKTDVKKAHEIYRLYLKRVLATIDQLNAAELALQLETERYTLGVTSFVEYANANRVLVQAQTDKAQAENLLLFQKVILDYAMGTLKPDGFQ